MQIQFTEPTQCVRLSAHITIWVRVPETRCKYMVRPTVWMGGPRSSAVDTMVVPEVSTSNVGCLSVIGDRYRLFAFKN